MKTKKTIIPQKIAILGASGSGKTTFAQNLSKRLNIPLHHLDKISWKPGWEKEQERIIKKRHAQICSKKKWIIDGNQINYIDKRFAQADIIIVFDMNRLKNLYRIVLRWLKFRKKQRPDLSPGCFEQLSRGYLKYVWNFDECYKPDIMHALEYAQKRYN